MNNKLWIVAALPLVASCLEIARATPEPAPAEAAAKKKDVLIIEDPPDKPVVLGTEADEEPERPAVAPDLEAEEPIPLDDGCRTKTRLADKNAAMQRDLERRLEENGWLDLAENESFAVAVVDLSQEGRHFYAGVNDDEMIYAASMPKIAILLSVIEAVHKKEIGWNKRTEERLRQMIVRSSNRDASWAFHLVGLDGIERTMRDPRYCFYDDEFGGLWVGRAYGGGGPTRRDPLHNISHGATARQTARFYTMLFREELVSPEWSRKMYSLMAPPAHRHKFVGGLGRRPDVEFLARKSGTWRNFHSDSTLIAHRDKRYVAVGVSRMRLGGKVLRKLIREIDDMVMLGDYRDGKLAKR